MLGDIREDYRFDIACQGSGPQSIVAFLESDCYEAAVRNAIGAARLEAGMVHVNDGPLNDEATIPFGGTGMSGNGSRYGGEANLDNFTEWQWVTVRDEPPTFPF